jgi:hypothetical protein
VPDHGRLNNNRGIYWIEKGRDPPELLLPPNPKEGEGKGRIRKDYGGY